MQKGTAVQFRDDDALKVDGFTADEQDQSLNCSLTKAEHPPEHATIGSPAVISISLIDAESNELVGTCVQDAETNEKDQDQSLGNVQTDHVNQGTCDSLQSMDVDYSGHAGNEHVDALQMPALSHRHGHQDCNWSAEQGQLRL